MKRSNRVIHARRVRRDSKLSAARRRLSIEPLEVRRLLTVVVNEIHVDPDVTTENVEFIEFYNDSGSAADVSGWVIDDAVDYVFPANTLIDPFGYYVVAQDADEFLAKFGTSPDDVWEEGDKLSNEGETIQVRTGAGQVVDEVDYQIGFPWPTVGEFGRSMELIHPSLPNDVGGSWRSSGTSAQDVVSLLDGSDSGWSYRKGTSEPSLRVGDWRQPAFVQDDTWLTGQTPLGYGDGDDNTILSDMRNNYSSVYLRNSFEVGEIPNTIEVDLYVDDGAAVWINGRLVAFAQVSNPLTNELTHDDTAANHEAAIQTFTINDASEFLVSGTNTIAVHALNQALTSSDFSIDVEVRVPAVTGAEPTPGMRNASFSTTAAPLLRRVSHSPEQPSGNSEVTITMLVTDSDGVGDVVLEYQRVRPGNYIRLTDAEYETSWVSLAMRDDGTGGDEVANDGIYSAIIPREVNAHRDLIRYRVTATDSEGASVRVPYADDPQPNFAYFVYSGIPDYEASTQPGVDPIVRYDGDVLEQMATYHLIANGSDVSNSQYNGSFNEVQFHGTLVYDGIVYDHIEYRNRGQASTYQVGKNKWKLNFTRGHSFQVRDDYGNLRDVPADKINILPGTNPWWRNDISTEGTVLSEPAAFKLYELAGTPASNTNYFQFRVIDGAEEVDFRSQYAGDFWGLYINIEQPDGRFLDERDLPDGNLYNAHGGVFGSTTQRNQGADQPSDRSDLQAFTTGANSTYRTEADWEQNLDLDSYFAWNQTNHLVNNSDIRNHENVNYYHNSETDLWHILPWDLDLTFEDRSHHNRTVTERENLREALTHAGIEAQYDNFSRNLWDLLISNGDAAKVVEEFANILAPNGDMTFVDSNQAQWDYHPDKRKQGIWYDNFNPNLLPSESFDGLVAYMENFVSPNGYGANLASGQRSDSGIPDTPTLTYLGDENYARDQLQFQTSAFSDPNGDGTFAAMEWRLAEIHNADVTNYDPTRPYIYEIEGTWESGELSDFDSDMSIPTAVVEAGKTYRVRVRMQDSSGKWSHWSAAEEFLAAAESNQSGTPVVIIEINYNPSDPSESELAAGFTDKDDFEFIELANVGTGPISLSELRFEKVLDDGIDFDFGAGAISSLDPGQRIVIVEDMEAFTFRYGDSIPVAGQWSGGLSNGDELLTLIDGDQVRQQFEYEDGWQPTTDNGGYSLQIRNATFDVGAWAVGQAWQASRVVDGTPGAPNTIGDFSGNGSVGSEDIDLLARQTTSGQDLYSFDLSGDGQVDHADMDFLIFTVLETTYGDITLDRQIDDADFEIWNRNRFTISRGWTTGDVNFDGFIDVSDFNIINASRTIALAAASDVVIQNDNERVGEDVSDLPWSNVFDGNDVNADGVVSPLDALLVINALNNPSAMGVDPKSGQLPLRTQTSQHLVDTDGNGLLSPLDALGVINHLNELAIDFAFEEDEEA